MNFFAIFIVTVAFIEFATSQPNLRWNKRSKNFEVIPEALKRATGIKTARRMTDRPVIRNFQGQPLKITYFEQRGIFEYFDNDTKVGGIFGEIWTTVCSLLNFTMVLSKETGPPSGIGQLTENGTYTGILRKAWLNETDVVPRAGMFSRRLEALEFSTGFWMQSIKFYSRGNWERNPTWVLNIFGKKVWTAIFAFLVTVSIASIVTQRILIRYQGKNLESEGFLTHLFYNFATLCNQPGSSSEKAGSGSNLLNVIVVLFAYLTLAAYNSRLIFSLSQESFAAPFTDVNSLMDETKYHIVILNRSSVHALVHSALMNDVFGRVKKSSRLKVVEHANDLYSYVCKHPDEYVFFDIDDEVALRGNMECDVEPVGYEYYPAAVASGFRRGFEPTKTIKHWLIKLREFGLVDGIKKRYMSPTRKKSVSRRATSLTIGMDHVSVIFGVLCLGMIGSTIMCIAENVIFMMNRPNAINLAVEKMSNYEPPVVAKWRLQGHAQSRYRN